MRPLETDAKLLQALADPTRLGIVQQLAAEGGVCACDLTACCDLRQPTVSHHLRVLREAGVVRGERRGSWVVYSLAPGLAERLTAIVRSIDPTAKPARRLPVLGDAAPAVP